MTTPATPRHQIDPAVLARALDVFERSAFVAGEWSPNDSDEPFEAVYQRVERAEAAVWRAVGLKRPAPPKLKGRR